MNEDGGLTFHSSHQCPNALILPQRRPEHLDPDLIAPPPPLLAQHPANARKNLFSNVLQDGGKE
jgi:hypothetical protein